MVFHIKPIIQILGVALIGVTFDSTEVTLSRKSREIKVFQVLYSNCNGLKSLDTRKWPENREFILVVVTPIFNSSEAHYVTLNNREENGDLYSGEEFNVGSSCKFDHRQCDDQKKFPALRPLSDIQALYKEPSAPTSISFK